MQCNGYEGEFMLLYRQRDFAKALSTYGLDANLQADHPVPFLKHYFD